MNKHQYADQKPWNPKAWIRYPGEHRGAPPLGTVGYFAGWIANKFIDRLLEQSRSK